MSAAYPATRARVSRTAALALVLVLGFAAEAARAGGSFYRFVDERGVVHFTNVQWDKRYTRVKLAPTVIGPEAFVMRPPHRRARTYDPLVVRVGREVGVPPALVKAVIHAESAFDPRAVSHKGAKGLMQLMPATARSLGVSDPFAAEQNIAGGTRYLRELRERFGSWTFALAAYNAGPDAVTKFGGIPPYRETQKYVRRVLTYYRQYHPQFAAR
ncbi:MAG TPA: lytic transglycosylase domain-containing protein [Myxococcota bacterium]|nr:lytic transglycosylase domain-containing protein [Myxococcota bacterium]